MRVAGEAVTRQAGIENGDLAAGAAELQGAGETGKAAADDDDVIHGDGLRGVDGGGWASGRRPDRHFALPCLSPVTVTGVSVRRTHSFQCFGKTYSDPGVRSVCK